MKPNLFSSLKLTFLLALNLVIAQTSHAQCGISVTAQMEAQHWPSPKADGPFEVRIRFVDLRHNGNSSILQGLDLDAAFEYLKERFYQPGAFDHGIRFKRYSDSVVTIGGSDHRNIQNYLDDFVPNHADRITVLIGSQDTPGSWFNAGISSAGDIIPSTKCVVSTNSIMSQAEFQHLIGHEIGHCFGLFQTHQNDQNFYQGYLGNAPCAIYGDLICDTPEDPGLQYKTEYGWFDGEWKCQLKSSVNPTDYQGVLMDNLMSYAEPECAENLTCQQALKARYMLASVPRMKACLTQATASNADPSKIPVDEKNVVISSNTVWNTPKYVAGIRVKSGNTLTITSTQVYFYPVSIVFADGTETWTYDPVGNTCDADLPSSDLSCGAIVVEKGAKLIVNNSTITTADCYPGFWWNGIWVHGDRTKSQTAANQGVVELLGATIENARTAVQTRNWDAHSWNSYGGIISASGSTI